MAALLISTGNVSPLVLDALRKCVTVLGQVEDAMNDPQNEVTRSVSATVTLTIEVSYEASGAVTHDAIELALKHAVYDVSVIDDGHDCDVDSVSVESVDDIEVEGE